MEKINKFSTWSYRIALLLTVCFLIVALTHDLLSALLPGLLVYNLVHRLAPVLPKRKPSERAAKIIAVFLISVFVIASLVGSGLGIWFFVHSESGSISHLLQKMAEIITNSKNSLPEWIYESLPDSAEDLQQLISGTLKTHAQELQIAGKSMGVIIAHTLIGMVLGAMISLHMPSGTDGILKRHLKNFATGLNEAFERVVFAQVRISGINTIFTAVYLELVLRAFDVHLPLMKTMIIVTFLAGLLPVIGNLISNSVIVVVSLSHSFGAALASLGFLIIIHKLEYFLNAKIVGTQIRSKAWEILMAMLFMEAIFGLKGLVAAPIFYAFIKAELQKEQLF
jgi:predicted PurR-regulated permease PerM